MNVLTAGLKAEALRLGFDRVGIAPAVAAPDYHYFRNWLDRGHDAGMTYLRRQEPGRSHPDRLLDGVRSVVMASLVIGRASAPSDDPTRGRIARYAQGGDYHRVLWRRLEALADWLEAQQPGTKSRAVADTAPLLERDFARLAGLGWIGKNTMLIDCRLGSHTVLGALLTDAQLDVDQPHATHHCGTCTRCLNACPTDAFLGPYQLDASRCISYWTIEHKGPIPDEFAASLEGWVFGCDVCQDVCPWNRKAPPGREPALQPRPEGAEVDLIAWLDADPLDFARTIQGSALTRAKRRGLLRNAALILGTKRVTAAVPALRRRLLDDEPVVRAAAAWALANIGGPEARAALLELEGEPEATVRAAIERALARLVDNRPDRDGSGLSHHGCDGA